MGPVVMGAVRLRPTRRHAPRHLHPRTVRTARGVRGVPCAQLGANERDPRTQHDADALRTWLGAMNGFDDRGVTLEPRAGFGWCAAATRAIRAGESLVQVPGEAFLTAATAAAPGSVCASLLQEADEQDAPLSEWQTLCLHLLCERARGAASRWAPYIAMLPDQRHHPLLWPRAAASQWLAGSPSLGTLEERWEQCEEDYLALRHLVGVASLDRILAAQQVGMDGEAGDEVEGRRVEDSARADRAAAEPATRMSQQPLVTRASVRWAAATLLSRAFSLAVRPPTQYDLRAMSDDEYEWPAEDEDPLLQLMQQLEALDGGAEAEEAEEAEEAGAPPPLQAEGTIAPEWKRAATVKAWEAEERAAEGEEGEEQRATREALRQQEEEEAEAEAAMAMQWADADDDDLEDNDGLWDGGPARALALVPWADMLNHSPTAGAGATLSFDARSDTAQLKAHRHYAAHEQVFDSFGPNKAPAALFLDYGFTDVSAAAAHRCTLPAALLGLPAAPANTALLRAIGIRLEDSTFQVSPDGLEFTTVALVRALAASAAELTAAGWEWDETEEDSDDVMDDGSGSSDDDVEADELFMSMSAREDAALADAMAAEADAADAADGNGNAAGQEEEGWEGDRGWTMEEAEGDDSLQGDGEVGGKRERWRRQPPVIRAQRVLGVLTHNQPPCSRATELAVLDRIQTALETALYSYPNSLEHDEELLVWSGVIPEADDYVGDPAPPASDLPHAPEGTVTRLSGLPLAAVAARWSEKRALRSALYVVQHQRSQLLGDGRRKLIIK